MKKQRFIPIMLTGLATVALALGTATAAFAGGFHQPQQSWQGGGHSYGGGYSGGNNNGNHGGNNGGGYNNGGGNYGSHQVIPDPKNPASVRDWSKPQAQSVSCVGAGCTLHYPTPRQQAVSHGRLICTNRGCHY